MYKSPIETFQTGIEYQLENDIMNMIQKYGITVDKDELLKALRYDRDQYDKGYADGKSAANDEIVRCKDCKYSYIGRDGKLRCDILYPSLSWVENDDFCSCAERKESDE